MRYRDLRSALASSAAICAVAIATPAMAQTKTFDVPAQSAATGIPELATQADVQILVSEDAVRGKSIRAIKGVMTVDQAVRRAAADADLRVVTSDGRTYTLASAVAAEAGADTGYRPAEIVVTAQKFGQRIQDVPIAISAFNEESLQAQKLEGGSDLLRAIPNVTFSKSNFTGYNFSIRGIGTKAISATTDAGVSVALNSTSLIQNRLFEQEYFDVERVEVLRGPQGTLYGRNATGGVINVITKKPDLKEFSGSIKGEVGNHNSRRLSAVINLPLSDRFGLRAAGAMTQRDGYGFNDVTDNSIDGRDLWSARLSARWEPTDWLTVDLMGERFQEDDNRARTTKQLCWKDEGPEFVGSFATRGPFQRALFSTGCKAGSLYEPGAFDTPNGLALPYIFAIPGVVSLAGAVPGTIRLPDGSNRSITLIDKADPYEGVAQSSDIRTISSLRDPEYRAKANIVELNIEAHLSDSLTFVSQSVYNDDRVYSTQDYNRFNSRSIFEDTSKWLNFYGTGPSDYVDLAPGGLYCDPQLGCSNTVVGQDISKGNSKQYSQEFRLQSSFDGPFNFSIGGNYTHFKYEADYYVFINTLTALSQLGPLGTSPDYTVCTIANGQTLPIDDPSIPPLNRCPYVDPNPLDSINGDGHNYFRSRNPYKLESYALFGEAYWDISPSLKLTAGLRVTRDRKTFTPVPSQLLLTTRGLAGGGDVYRGYPEDPDIIQRWTKPTGRLVLDWRPETSFSDDTMIYASYSRGYKAGGANPPSIGLTDRTLAEELGIPPGVVPTFDRPIIALTAVNYPATFKPEYVNAFEIGTKNSFMNGALTLNATAFYYDYKGYQVSKIVDRTAVNENFDAKVYGLEFETLFAPTERLVFNANLGLMKTKIGKGEKSIDLFNRTQGNPDYVVVKPWMQLPSNCVVPTSVAEYFLEHINYSIENDWVGNWGALCGGTVFDGGLNATPGSIVPVGYDPAQNPNGGAGFYADLSGNELPNSPRFTVNIGAQYTIPFSDGWEATLRGDYYRQGKSFARVYNTVADRLRGWGNANFSLRISNEDQGLTFEAYIKNAFDKAPITDAFLNSDDSGLTTNVFTLDPRIIGFSIAKKF